MWFHWFVWINISIVYPCLRLSNACTIAIKSWVPTKPSWKENIFPFRCARFYSDSEETTENRKLFVLCGFSIFPEFSVLPPVTTQFNNFITLRTKPWQIKRKAKFRLPLMKPSCQSLLTSVAVGKWNLTKVQEFHKNKCFRIFFKNYRKTRIFLKDFSIHESVKILNCSKVLQNVKTRCIEDSKLSQA